VDKRNAQALSPNEQALNSNERALSPFVALDSIHGTFIVNRYCKFQAEALVTTGRTHIEAELDKLFLIVDRLSDGMVIIDGGANIGFVTIPLAQRIRHRQGKVISFEPQPMLYHALGGALALNDLENVRLYQLGLGAAASKAALPAIDYHSPSDFGTVSLRPFADRQPDAEAVELIALDSLRLPRVDLIKLDVEGYEYEALRGALGLIRSQRPLLWVEYFLIGEARIREALAEVPGYVFGIMDYQNMLCAPSEKLASMGLKIDP